MRLATIAPFMATVIFVCTTPFYVVFAAVEGQNERNHRERFLLGTQGRFCMCSYSCPPHVVARKMKGIPGRIEKGAKNIHCISDDSYVEDRAISSPCFISRPPASQSLRCSFSSVSCCRCLRRPGRQRRRRPPGQRPPRLRPRGGGTGATSAWPQRRSRRLPLPRQG